jgi:hypothetical protein
MLRLVRPSFMLALGLGLIFCEVCITLTTCVVCTILYLEGFIVLRDHTIHFMYDVEEHSKRPSQRSTCA